MLISDMMISTTRKTPAPTAILAAISWGMYCWAAATICGLRALARPARPATPQAISDSTSRVRPRASASRPEISMITATTRSVHWKCMRAPEVANAETRTLYRADSPFCHRAEQGFYPRPFLPRQTCDPSDQITLGFDPLEPQMVRRRRFAAITGDHRRRQPELCRLLEPLLALADRANGSREGDLAEQHRLPGERRA